MEFLNLVNKVIKIISDTKYNGAYAKIISCSEKIYEDEYPEGYFIYIVELQKPVYSKILNRDIKIISAYSYSSEIIN